ncbi:NAD(P)-dependent oxidoreductase [Rhodococcus sp. WS4]|nr:NAD(P)-dependent oxidoreductase [Rhodococcus sp. WS4]
MGLLEGKVALITGAARGQGRSHATRLAEEGADIIAIDICRDMETMVYPGPTPEDLEHTVKLVEAEGRRIVAIQADVRDADAMSEAVKAGVSELGRIDIVCANAGVLTSCPAPEITPEKWAVTVDVCLTGVWNTISPTIPYLIDQGDGGSIVITSSTAGLKGHQGLAHYTAAKHGVVGLARSLAGELGPHNIRVNTVHPTAMLTDMVNNPYLFQSFLPDKENVTLEDVQPFFDAMSMLPNAFIEPVDISNAIVWLTSPMARYVTAAAIPVDLGCTQI